jgi:hypothetical protein
MHSSLNSIPIPSTTKDEMEKLPKHNKCNPEEDFLLWHQRLAHMPFVALQHMAKVGQLPKRLANISHSKRQSYMLGKASKLPWRVKGQVSHVNNATKPGKQVSVDQLESSTLGLIAQPKGIPTTRRYKCVTVFVDNYTRFTYDNLQQSNTSDETLQTKKDLESLAERLGVKVCSNHADNGRFTDNALIQHSRAMGQGLTYCGVHAHFQNVIAETRIRDLQGRSRTMIMNAKYIWPDAIDTSPLALCNIICCAPTSLLLNQSKSIPWNCSQTPWQILGTQDKGIILQPTTTL